VNRRAFLTTLAGAVAGAVTGVTAKPLVWKQHPPPKFKNNEPPIHKQVQQKRFPLQIKCETTEIKKPKIETGWYFYETIGYSYHNPEAIHKVTFT
jgi:hypothetical protein